MKKFLNLKYAHTFLLVLLCSLISSTFTACSNDDDEPENQDFLIGTWKYQFTYDDGDVGFTLYTFKESGSGWVFENDGGSIDQNEPFTYIHYPKECRIKIFYLDNDYERSISYEKISDTRIIANMGYEVGLWEKQ